LDILPEDQPYWRHIYDRIHHICALYGYRQIETPIFEETSLFVRSVGETTDIVEKEMYSLTDKGGDPITLRPEFTAGTVRAYIEHGMHTLPQPVKLYSIGPAFRYERPQAGRTFSPPDEIEEGDREWRKHTPPTYPGYPLSISTLPSPLWSVSVPRTR
jgi:histidyl-tRNA synthetase